MPEPDPDREVESLLEELSSWRAAALESWAGVVEQTRRDDVLERHLNASRERVAELQDKVRALRVRADDAEARARAMESSSSWRMTGPLRSATTAARRLRSKTRR